MRPRLAVIAAACALAAAPHIAVAKSGKLEAAYVLIGAQGPLARAVYKDTKDCPKIVIDKAAKDMSVRARPQSGKNAAFPILVCDYQIPAGTTSAAIDGNKLPLPPSTLTSVAVLGDTGCRLKADKKKSAQADDDDDDDDDKAPAASSGKFQDCDKSSKWPFSTLAASVAGKKPQLIVHVGDYLYRESPCPKGDKGCKGSPYGDN